MSACVGYRATRDGKGCSLFGRGRGCVTRVEEEGCRRLDLGPRGKQGEYGGWCDGDGDGCHAEGNGREAAASAFAVCSEYQMPRPLFVAAAVGQPPFFLLFLSLRPSSTGVFSAARHRAHARRA